MSNFWKELNGPIMALAPMEDVTDTVFREVVLNLSEKGQLNILFSEFLSTDGFCHSVGRKKVIHRLIINESELLLTRVKEVKLVAQIWGTNPDKFYKTAKHIFNETPFEGIDINMGCPMKNIIKKGACSALINTPDLALELIDAVSSACPLPLSVKTRIGFKSVVTHEWISKLLSSKADALIIHGRIQSMMSEGEADWNEIGKAVELRNALNPGMKIVGNGDLVSMDDALMKTETHGTDGAMVGRGIFANPWFFNRDYTSTTNEKMEALKLHARLYEATWDGQKPWAIIKRFFKIYANNFPEAAKLRALLMETRNSSDVEKAIDDFQFIEGAGES